MVTIDVHDGNGRALGTLRVDAHTPAALRRAYARADNPHIDVMTSVQGRTRRDIRPGDILSVRGGGIYRYTGRALVRE